MPTVIEQLKELKTIKPRPEWIESQRDLLLSQITRQNTEKNGSNLFNYWLLFKSVLPTGFVKFIARPVGVLSAVAVLLFGSGVFGVNASKSSLPGDFLYPVKLTSEKVKVGLAESGEEKAKAHVAIAEERVREIEKIVQVERSSETKKNKVKIAADGLKKEMEGVKKELDVVKDGVKSAKEIVVTAKEVDDKIEKIAVKVKEVKTSQSVIQGEETGRVGDPQKEIIKDLNAVTVVAEQTGVKAVSVLVEKHKAGDSPLSDKEVVNVLEKKITTTENNIKDVTARVTSVGEAVKGSNPLPATTESNNISVENQKIIGEIKDKPVEAEKILTEAKDLLNQGDLTAVMEKVRQTAEIVNTVTDKVDSLQINIATPTTVPATPTVTPPANPTTTTPGAPAVSPSSVPSVTPSTTSPTTNSTVK